MGLGTYVLGPILGAIVGFNLYNLLFVETELAEVAESRSERAKTSALNATLTQSEVHAEVEADDDDEVTATTAKTHSTAKKASAKKSSSKKSSSKRHNPNAA